MFDSPPDARPAAFRLALLGLALAAASLGCQGPECENPDGTWSRYGTPAADGRHCGFCGNACRYPGIAAEYQRCLYGRNVPLGACQLTADAVCAPGYHDLDDRPGCECYGPSPDDCHRCGAVDVPHTGLDEDCDLRIDEAIPNRDRNPAPPNGPAGAQPDEIHAAHADRPIPFERVACGDRQTTCALPADGADVRCVATVRGLACRPVLDEGPSIGERRVGAQQQALSAGEADCTDAVDDDGNGVIDDGPTCQTLVPAVAQPECHGATPGPGCPSSYVPLDPIWPRLPGSDKPLVADMTYDVLLDRHEATLGQVQRFLDETGRCDRPAEQRHPLCDVTTDPALPAGGLDWCVAYEYCQWAGKRLPTELEWLRAFGGTSGLPVTGAACEEGGQTADCGAEGPRTVGQTGGHAAKGLHGESVLYDALGNVAEWLFDARLEPCEAPWADCSRRTGPRASRMPRDPVAHAPAGEWRRERLVRGGGWGSERGAGSVEHRQYADPGVEVAHYGVRCAQTFRPPWGDREGARPIDQVPYDRTLPADLYAQCTPLPPTERLAARTRPQHLRRAVAACVPGVDDDGLDRRLDEALIGSTPLLFSVTNEGEGAATMSVETGLVPGSEAFWLKGRTPTRVFVERGCTPFGCRFERPPGSAGRITLALDTTPSIHADLLSMRPIGGAIRSCLGAMPFEDHPWRMEWVVSSDAVARLFRGAEDPRAAACQTLRCHDDVPANACAEQCAAWRMTVDVRLSPLTVPW